MSTGRSFTEYVANRFYNDLFAAVGSYVEENYASLDLRSYAVKYIDSAVLSDITIKRAYVGDSDDMRITFDVALEAEIEVYEVDRHHDNSDVCNRWFLVKCGADLALHLDDFRIFGVSQYSQKACMERPLDDNLVPYIKPEKLDEAAEDFLRRNYPKALLEPMAIDVADLAHAMGLAIERHHITKDFSVFGQIFFADCDAELYDIETDTAVHQLVKAKTIVVDPKAFFLRNIGSVNNTIVHECVHWDRHRKVFELERLYNSEATQIKCMVIGGVKDSKARTATDHMEWQANSLAPRIQMPIDQFKTKATAFIQKYRREFGDVPLVDIMELVIEELATFFCVSRQAAKIRMVDAGYQEAVGAFTYIDGRYVRPHAFKKGSVEKCQTYSIGVDDAAFVALSDMRLRDQAGKGAYVYVDSHFCLNDPKYIINDDNGRVVMTEYARLHIDECCLAFDLKVKSKNKYGEQYYKECVLYRDVNSGIEFQVAFSGEANKDIMAKADAILGREVHTQNIINAMPPKFGEALVYLMKLSNQSVESLAENARMDVKMLQRMRNDPDYPKNIESVVAVCIGMHLQPEVSGELMKRSGFSLRLAQSESHLFYKFFLDSFYTHTVDECNEILTAKGYDIMTGTY